MQKRGDCTRPEPERETDYTVRRAVYTVRSPDMAIKQATQKSCVTEHVTQAIKRTTK